MNSCKTQKPRGQRWERDTLPSPARPPVPPRHSVCLSQSMSPVCLTVSSGGSLLRKPRSGAGPEARCICQSRGAQVSVQAFPDLLKLSLHVLPKIAACILCIKLLQPRFIFFCFSLAKTLHLHFLHFRHHRLRLNCLSSALCLQQLSGKNSTLLRAKAWVVR